MPIDVELETIFAPIPSIERGKAYVLGAHPKGESILYGVGKLVIIRNIENPKKCEIYSGHNKKVGVAKYAPSGNYACSGDEAGNIHIWYKQDEDLIKKNEFRPLVGEIRDLQWGPESKRIVLCGGGGDKHGAAIMWDSGNNIGSITGIAKCGNSIDFKRTRPYRAAAADEKGCISFYTGPPFKTEKIHEAHEGRFANCVRFSPDGKYFASASSDMHVILYDGKTGEPICHLGDEGIAHSGGVYSLSWSADGKELFTVSADKSAKIWNVETKELVTKFVLGTKLDDQIYSCIWAGDNLIAVSLSGCFSYLDRNNPEKPLRVIHGHSKTIVEIINLPSDRPRHVSADASGKILMYDTEAGEAFPFCGQGHTNKITGLCYDADSKEIVSSGFDDKVRFTSSTSLDFSSATTVSLDSQPTSVTCIGDGRVVVNAIKSLVLIQNKKKVFEIPHDEDEPPPMCMAANGTTVAVEKEKGGVRIYEVQCNSLVLTDKVLECPHKASCMAFSPDGSMLAVGYEDKIIRVYMVSDGWKMEKSLIGHTTRPTVLSWSPDGQLLASAGMDGQLVIWNIAEDYNEQLARACGPYFITCLAWQSDSSILTGSNDCLARKWTVSR